MKMVYDQLKNLISIVLLLFLIACNSESGSSSNSSKANENSNNQNFKQGPNYLNSNLSLLQGGIDIASNSVESVSTNGNFVVIMGEHVEISNDGGESFSSVYDGTSQELYNLNVDSNNNIFFTADDKLIVINSSNYNTSSTSTYNVESISCINSVCIIQDEDGERLRATNDGGATFIDYDISTEVSGYPSFDLREIVKHEESFYIIGEAFIFKTSDFQNYTKVSTNNCSAEFGLVFSNRLIVGCEPHTISFNLDLNDKKTLFTNVMTQDGIVLNNELFLFTEGDNDIVYKISKNFNQEIVFEDTEGFRFNHKSVKNCNNTIISSKNPGSDQSSSILFSYNLFDSYEVLSEDDIPQLKLGDNRANCTENGNLFIPSQDGLVVIRDS